MNQHLTNVYAAVDDAQLQVDALIAVCARESILSPACEELAALQAAVRVAEFYANTLLSGDACVNPDTWRAPDFECFANGGALWTVQPMTADAASHLRLNTDAESTFSGAAVIVEHRYIGALIRSLADAGYRVRVLD